jgi:large subunit ribosomal protein L35
MPKLKTKSGAKKRFKLTAKGKVKCSCGGYSHLNISKRQGRKRRLRKGSYVPAQFEKQIKSILNG